jgi:hypothetical protein
MISYEFWRHEPTGDVRAVKLRDGIVVACTGPLHHDDVNPDFLEALDYVAEGSAEVEAARDEYALLTGV